jgi:glycosyltransferase involved in cell wall biosynthesis
MVNVSVICTVLNEGQSIQNLLNSLMAQTYAPDEVIFVDGGSTDETLVTLRRYADEGRLPLRIIVEPGANISRGRNVAIQAAAGPVIASTDAGVRLHEHWLEELVKPFQTDEPPAVVAGFFAPDPQTAFEVAMGATVLPALYNINPATFLPSSRSVAFLKSSWQAIGGYPEWLDFCEDLIFDIRLRDKAGPFVFTPEALVYFRPRNNLRVFFKQYYQYARGDGKANLWRKRHIIRYGTYLLALPLLMGLGIIVSPWWWLLGIVGGGLGMFFTPYRRLPGLWHNLPAWQKLQAILWVPVIRITGDIAKMIGYPVGWRWRLERLSTQPELRWQYPKTKQAEASKSG